MNNIDELAPIALFVYNRPEKAKRCIESLKNCEGFRQSKIIVFADGPKDLNDKKSTDKTRAVVEDLLNDNNSVFYFKENNFCLANSLYHGVSKVLQKNEKIIVIEDDLIFNKGFLTFMNSSLNKYKEYNEIFQISGHVYGNNEMRYLNSGFFSTNTNSWGWATWRRAWKYFDEKIFNSNPKLKLSEVYSFNIENNYNYNKILEYQSRGKVDSWAIKWYYIVFMNSGKVFYPNVSLVKNCGFDGGGTHTFSSKNDQTIFNEVDFEEIIFPKSITFDPKVLNKYFNVIKVSNRSFFLNKLIDFIYYKILNFFKKHV